MGCTGTKVLDEPTVFEITQPLAKEDNENIEITLDWVTVRNGAETWAKNANWDGYHLSITNRSDQTIEVKNLVVVDFLNYRLQPKNNLVELSEASKFMAERYDSSEIEVQAGLGAETIIKADGVMTVAGVAGGYAITYGLVGGGVSTIASTASAALGLIVVGPVILYSGAKQRQNNEAVNDEIRKRYTRTPLLIEPKGQRQLIKFFPFAPSPQIIELTYKISNVEHVIAVDINEALKGLHINTES